MKSLKKILLIFFILLTNIANVKASCTIEEKNELKSKVDNIKITYKHLGEIKKSDGTKAYNEFLVTASNIEEGLYIHLSPMTNENFIENETNIQIKLTTGTWIYSIYSSKCGETLKDIKVVLPKFNVYSLDPLCDGINSDEFKLCSKYYEYEVSRDTFERKIKDYRLQNNIKDDLKEVEKESIFNQMLDYIEIYKLYIVGVLILILLILIPIIIKTKRKQKQILQ